MKPTANISALLARIAELKRNHPSNSLLTSAEMFLYKDLAPALEAMAQRERELVADNASLLTVFGDECLKMVDFIRQYAHQHDIAQCHWTRIEEIRKAEHPGSALLAEMESLRQRLADATHKLEVGEGAEGARGLKMLQNCMALAEIAPPQSLAAWITYTKSELEAAVQRADEAETKADDARVEKEGALCEVARANRAEAMANKRAAEAERKLEEKTSELELAVQHDRQPYPTAEAYEKVCVALEKSKAALAERDRRIAVLEAEPPFLIHDASGITGEISHAGVMALLSRCATMQHAHNSLAAELARVRAALELIWLVSRKYKLHLGPVRFTGIEKECVICIAGLALKHSGDEATQQDFEKAIAALAPEPAPEGEKT